MLMILCLVIILGVVVRAMTPAERVKALRATLATARQLKDAAMRPRPDLEPFHEALRTRKAVT